MLQAQALATSQDTSCVASSVEVKQAGRAICEVRVQVGTDFSFHPAFYNLTVTTSVVHCWHVGVQDITSAVRSVFSPVAMSSTLCTTKPSSPHVSSTLTPTEPREAEKIGQPTMLCISPCSPGMEGDGKLTKQTGHSLQQHYGTGGRNRCNR